MKNRFVFHRIGAPRYFALFVSTILCGDVNTVFGAPTITYVQSNYATPQTPQPSVSVTFTGAQSAADLNVVVVGWNDSTATVTSVTDTKGNIYVRAVGPTVQAGAASQSIYYAKNIAPATAGANVVTVIFSSAAVYPDIRIVEYGGADLSSPVDVTAASSGNSTNSSSGSATTTNPTDLIFGANLVLTETSGPGSGFSERLLTVPDGDIVEDEMVTQTGSYSATAPLSSGVWIMQMVAFRTPVGSAPSVSGVSPNSGVASGGTSVTITGTNFAAGDTVTFGGVPASNVIISNSTTITATTPAGTGAATVTVTTPSGLSGSLVGGFTYISSPTVTNVSPNTGPLAGGTAVTISGTNFLAGASVTFGPGSASTVVVVSTTTITVVTPAGSAGPVTVAVTNGNGLTGTLVSGFTYSAATAPTVSGVSPGSGSTAGGTVVTLTGANFATGATVMFGGTAATNIIVSSSTTIIATTPAGSAGAVTVTVTVNGQSGSLVGGFRYYAPTIIAYVQGNYATPQSPQTAVNVTFTAAQKAGDLNVVVVGWNDSTAAVAGVTDKSGNQYTLAVGPTIQVPVASQSIYYARNIGAAVAGANSVTVTFTSSAAYPDIRILEYSGVEPNNPVDASAGTSGNGTLSNSGSVTTTNANDMLFGANLVQTLTSGAGGGFTARLLTSPDGDIGEDQMVTTTGTYSATAPLSSGQWIMQIVAFRAASGGSTAPAVSLTQTTLSFGSVSTGATSTPQTVTLTNVGGASLNISSVSISGGNSGDFLQTNTCGSVLAQGAHCTVTATFTPTTTGVRSSGIIIFDNAPDSPQTINLSGTGVGFSIRPRATALTFTHTQQFTATTGGVTWSVDGVVGGSVSSGTITTSGLYTPPAATGTHTVRGATSSQSASATVYITNYSGTLTYHNDNLRTGQNISETVLTPNNVTQSQFGKLLSYALDGIAFASPLYMANVNIPTQGYHNVVYVATENDSVYAFDSDGLSTGPLWHVSFLGSGVTTVPCADTGECGDIPTQIGITSTPVIDGSSGTLYVVAATKEGSQYVQRLHALDITTGAEKFGGPVVLQGSVTGTGSGTSGGKVAFDPLRENQRPGLLLSNGVVYLAFGSHGDNSPWHGWVLGYNSTTLRQTLVYNVTPNGNGGGIWHGGGGLATDATGDVYFVTSNGDFDRNSGGVDYGDSVEKLSPTGSVVDYFTPHDQQNMSVGNLDLGAGGPVMLVDQTSGPYPHLLITAGKSGTIYVINRDNMGHFNPNDDSQIVQSLVGALPSGGAEAGNFSTPVFFNGYVYFGAVNDVIRTFQLANGTLSTTPTSQSAAIYGVRGASFAISANGSTNGILWALQNNGTSSDNDVGSPGVLFAYDATNLASELYDSSQAGSRDTLDNAAKFSIPLVANGKVFVAGQTQLTVFGLLP